MTQPAKKTRPHRGILHHLYGLLTFALVLLLPCQLLLWWLLHNNAQFVLPDEATEKIRTMLRESGLDVRLGEVKVSLAGRVEIKELELGQPGGRESLLTVQKIVADFNLFDLVQGTIDPRRVLVDGGTLYCPATGSPDGKKTVVFRDIRARVSQEGRWVNFETVQARLGEMPIVGYDMVLPRTLFVSGPKEKKDDAERGLGKITAADWKRGIQMAESMLKLRSEMEKLGKPSLEVTTMPGMANSRVVFALLAQGSTFTLPGNAVAQDARLSFTIYFDGEKLLPGRDSLLSVRSATWTNDTGEFSVQTGSLSFASRFSLDWNRPISGYFSACNVVVNGEPVDFVEGVVDWSQFPSLSTNSLIVNGTDWIKFSGIGNWETREVKANFSASIAPGKYMENHRIKPLIPEEISSLRFYSVPELTGVVQIDPGLKFSHADLKVALGATSFEDWRIVEGNAEARITLDKFDLVHADLRARNYRAEGSFYTGFTNESEYRVSIRGNTQPEYLNQYLPDWWTEIWKEIKLNPENLPLADLDIHGQWEGRPDEAVFCAVAGRDALIRGEHIDLAELRIVEVPGLISLFNMHAMQNGLSAVGDVQFHYVLPEYKLHSIQFLFHGALPKETAINLVGEGLPEMLSPIKAAEPVSASVFGRFHYEGSPTPGREQVFVTAEGKGPMSAWDIPFSDFQGTVAYDDDLVVITVNQGTYAGGKVVPVSEDKELERSIDGSTEQIFSGRPSRAWLDLRPENPTLRIDAEILNAGRVAFFDGLARLKENDKASSPPAQPSTPDQSKMNIRFNGTVTVPLLETLSGTGCVYYYDPSIPNLHVFGGLSRILDRVGLGITSFSLDRAQSDFTIQRNKIYFPNGKIDGPNCNVMAVGNYDFSDDQLNFKAMLTVTVGNNIPVIGHVFDVMNRIPRLTPVNITGSMDDPKWSLEPTLLGKPLDETLGRPPANEVPSQNGGK